MEEKTNLFTFLFAENSCLDAAGKVPPISPRIDCSMAAVQIHQKDILKILLTLDVNKASGPDGIKAKVFRTCTPWLSPLLTCLSRLPVEARLVRCRGRGSSSGDLLAYATHIRNEAIQKHGEALAVSFDISKALDRVWHASLISKLPFNSIPDGLCIWISNFLTERSIRVVLDGYSSNLKNVDTGIPQGSVLSAIFLLHK